jgi:hypothetical protein
MKRRVVPLLGLLALTGSLLIPSASAVAQRTSISSAEPFCEIHPGACPDTRTHKDYEGNYVGHDEPSVLFYSDRAGSGNSNTWNLQIPHEAPVLPTQDGTGGTWNFQLHPAIWFGMALCESQSYPNPGTDCTPDTDANIKDGADPDSADWIGNHVGSGFMELQFYPPGYVQQFTGFSCDATKWCAAVAIFGLSDSLTQTNNIDCLQRAGEEFANFAYLTKSGVPQGPPDPLNFDFVQSGKPGPDVLYMNAGDQIAVSIHDSQAGLVTAITDSTTGQSASMTASVANGFAHPLFQPNASTCTEEPYAFHPMYSTSNEHTRVPWAAHSYNVAFSDEIGHFEFCNRANPRGNCVNHGADDVKKDGDDTYCFNASASLFVKIGGCLATEYDFDGTSYQTDWPGTSADVSTDQQMHPESFLFTSPLSGGLNYERVAFEADLPAIEFATGCDTTTGDGCTNPPPGADFYPLYSTRGVNGCAWQEGGALIPGTTNTFGGTSTSEYGAIYALVYPDFPGEPGTAPFFENFRNILSTNPCPSTGQLPS